MHFRLPRLVIEKAPLIFSSLVFMAGVAVLTGFFFDIPLLTGQAGVSAPMAASTAFCFAFAGAAVAAKWILEPVRAVRLQVVSGWVLLALSLVGVLALLHFPEWQPIRGALRSAAQMSPGALAGFGLTGTLFLLLARAGSRTARNLIRVLTAALAAVGLLGLLSYAVNMDYLYLVPDARRMAFSTALCFVLLALAIWGAWRRAEWNSMDQRAELSTRIYRTIDVLVTLIVASVVLVTFGLSQGRSEQVMLDQMSIVGKDKRLFFATVLDAHLDKAVQIATRPAIVKFLRDYIAEGAWNDPVKKAPLVASTESFVQHGFSAFSYVADGERVLATAGKFTENPEQSLRVSTKYDWQLLWKDGYILRIRLPVQDGSGQSGFIVTEQHLDELTRMHREATSQGKTGDMVVCALIEGAQHCYPFRWGKTSGTYNAFLDGKALPLTRAISGEVATDITTDFRRQRVMAAFGPIGTTEFGMAVKRDMVELYAPVRKQFFLVLPFLVMLIGGSIWLIRLRVHPLVAALEESRLEMKRMAMKDGLTGLPNRILFLDRLKQAMARTMRQKALMALLYLDLDHFKKINDSLGHASGDEALIWFAKRLEASVRASDTVARLGGDEFVVILENIGDIPDAERIALAILASVNQADATLPNALAGKLNASIGLTFYRGEAISPEELIHQADTALYESKNAGRGRYQLYTASDAPSIA
jgi:diguanylate cyclase (GGDEF)-like protein